jgi:hypothetical protein
MLSQMTTLSDRSAFAAAAFAGALGWAVISYGTGRHEAWDSEWYVAVFLPGMAILVAWLGFLAPRGAWRWAFVPFAAQAIVAFAQNPTGSLMPLGLIVFAVFSVVCLVPALVGSVFRRWFDRQSRAGA